jgi:hypothetical protein
VNRLNGCAGGKNHRRIAGADTTIIKLRKRGPQTQSLATSPVAENNVSRPLSIGVS